MKRLIGVFLSLILIIPYTIQWNIQTVHAETAGSSVQQFTNIVLFAQFAGDNADTDAQFFSDNREKLIEYYNGDYAWSLTNYLSAISYGQFQVQNLFPQDNGTMLQSYTLSITEEQAQSGSVDDVIIQELLNDMVSNHPELANEVLDYDNDGSIDNVTVILRGGENESTVPSLYPHKSTYSGMEQCYGKLIRNYNILNTYRLMERTVSEETGMIAHEFLHSIGYSDLYNNSDDYPVYTWDIMAATSRYLCYPLAYTRMAVSNWLTIDTITNSQTLTLDVQDNSEGNQAYILKSPLNDKEVFVVEFRKQGESSLYSGNYFLDEKIGGSGIIVYRVDTSAEYLSNYYGSNSIYVFRPQENQNGYNSVNSICVQNAFLSQESGRTTMGSADMSATLEDGALTFSDGTNSGIVIQNVSGSAGSQMTLDVTIPNASEVDGWTDTGFPDAKALTYEAKTVTILEKEGILYAMAYHSGNLQAYQYQENTWTALGSGITGSVVPTDMKLIEHQGDLYLAYIDGETSKLKLMQYGSGIWQMIGSMDNATSGIDACSQNGELYLTYIDDNTAAKLVRMKGNGLELLGTYASGSFYGQPNLEYVNGRLYTAVRNANGNRIEVYQYSNGFSRISSDTLTAGTYDMASLDNQLYICLGGDNLQMYSYNGTSWNAGACSEIACFEPRLTQVGGRLYVLTSPNSGTGYSKVYRYNEALDNYTREGLAVDSNAQNLTLTSMDNQLYISYVQMNDDQILVKRKDTKISLVSLSVTPPAQTTYVQGAAMNTNGLRVDAVYSDGSSKEIIAGNYSLTGFTSDTVGTRQAVIEYQGVRAGFSYTITKADTSGGNAGGSTDNSGGSNVGGITEKPEGPVNQSVTIYNGIDYRDVYNYQYYINRYGDVRCAYGNDAEAVLEHFVTCGMKEGRQGSAEFNVQAYRERNRDLNRKFGTDYVPYYIHYMYRGKQEGRSAGLGTQAQKQEPLLYGLYGVNYRDDYGNLDSTYYLYDVRICQNDSDLNKTIVQMSEREALSRISEQMIQTSMYNQRKNDVQTTYYLYYGMIDNQRVIGTVSAQGIRKPLPGIQYYPFSDIDAYAYRFMWQNRLLYLNWSLTKP